MTCAATARELLTVAEAAERYKLAPKTIYKWIRCGALTQITIGPTKEVRVFADEMVSSLRPADSF